MTLRRPFFWVSGGHTRLLTWLGLRVMWGKQTDAPSGHTPGSGGLILQARPSHFYVSGECLRAAAGAWQVRCGPSLVRFQSHPLAFLKGLVSQGPGKLPQCFLPGRDGLGLFLTCV